MAWPRTAERLPARTPRRTAERLVLAVFPAAAVVLAAWTIVLAIALSGPSRTEWVGYDVGLTAAVGATALLARRRDRRLGPSCALVAALLAADTWFDLVTAPPDQFAWSVLSALTLEWPFAALSAVVAWRLATDRGSTRDDHAQGRSATGCRTPPR